MKTQFDNTHPLFVVTYGKKGFVKSLFADLRIQDWSAKKASDEDVLLFDSDMCMLIMACNVSYEQYNNVNRAKLFNYHASRRSLYRMGYLWGAGREVTYHDLAINSSNLRSLATVDLLIRQIFKLNVDLVTELSILKHLSNGLPSMALDNLYARYNVIKTYRTYDWQQVSLCINNELAL